MAIRVYNTLTRRKEPFEPLQPGKVRIYLCGPTVYMNSHIGHGVGPVIFDTIKRYLRYRGYEVTLVVNITDIEDKLIKRAREENTTVDALAGKVTENYFECIRRLNVTNVDHFPRATEYVGPIIEYVQRIIDRGFAYVSEGDVYFDVDKFKDYGRLSNRRTDELLSGTRATVGGERKQNPLDFVLWKSSKPGEPTWDSPWGPGRPGWHIECSVMSSRLLGEEIDIHGGGMELIFPHHEDEIAQSVGATGKQPVKYWLHNGLMKLGGEKMSKSLGNLVTMDDLFAKFDPETVRFFLLSTHYRRPIDFSDGNVRKVETGLQQFYRLFERVQRITGRSPYDLEVGSGADGFAPSRTDDGSEAKVHAELVELVKDRFEAAMDDDFNSAGAIAAMFDGLTVVNRYVDEADLEGGGATDAQKQWLTDCVRAIRTAGSLLGVFEQPRTTAAAIDPKTPAALAKLCAESGLTASQGMSPEKMIQGLIDLRGSARKDKKFALADRIRTELAAMGIVLEDRPGGTIWTKPPR